MSREKAENLRSGAMSEVYENRYGPSPAEISRIADRIATDGDQGALNRKAELEWNRRGSDYDRTERGLPHGYGDPRVP